VQARQYRQQYRQQHPEEVTARLYWFVREFDPDKKAELQRQYSRLQKERRRYLPALDRKMREYGKAYFRLFPPKYIYRDEVTIRDKNEVQQVAEELKSIGLVCEK
jgi:hypothetical protein